MKEVKDLAAYELLKEQELKGIHSKGMLLRHKKTGARICLVSNKDENKVFQIGFRTPPENSTGVPHIIEHSVLCGSEKFPLKDPFVELIKGSLNTFINAMTYPDKTIYPVASCNQKDFQNLCDVYMDAVLHPNIYKREEIFRQEGWHYELEKEEGPLTINGVVYNEMKGAYSSAEDILFEEIKASLYPDTCYAKDSGGDPDHIPELTREYFLDFHSRYYHPSNSFIYFYGDMDMAEKLEWLDREYLSKYDHLEIDSTIVRQKPFEKQVKVHKYYNVSSTEPLEANTYLSFNAVVGDALDAKQYIAFDVLNSALLTAPGAPVKQALLDAGIGKDIGGSYVTSLQQPCLMITATNAEPSQCEQFEQIIRDTLKGLVASGIDKKSLEAALNSSEFKYREADYGRAPKGLLYGFTMMESWLYDENEPFTHVDAADTYEFLKQQIQTDYFEQLIQKYLLDNTHTSVLCLEPKRGILDEKQEKLNKELEARRQAMSKEEKEELIEATKRLKAYQEAPTPDEDLRKIPLLNREDLEKKAAGFKNEEMKFGDIPCAYHDYDTNGIHYLNLTFDMKDVPAELIPYASILKSAWRYVDTDRWNYFELANEIDRKTGGIEAETNVYSRVEDENVFSAKFQIKSKTLNGKLSEAMEMIREIIAHSHYEDTKRLKEVIGELKVRLQQQISASGNYAAMMRANSYFSKPSKYKELLGGIEFYHVIKRIDENFEQEKDALVENLKKLEKVIFRPENLLVSTTCDREELAELEKEIAALKEVLFTEPVEKNACNLELVHENEAFFDASQIQYVAKCGSFKNAGYEYNGAMNVVNNIFSSEYLWLNVRVKGGAYGCSGGFNRNGGVYMTSYRDPNLSKTIEVYDNAPAYLEQFEADEREMTKYIIGTISMIDTPLNPAAKGERSLNAYLTGVTFERIQKERDEVLNAQVEDIRAVAAPLRAALEQNYLCAVGNEAKIKEEQRLFDKVESLN